MHLGTPATLFGSTNTSMLFPYFFLLSFFFWLNIQVAEAVKSPKQKRAVQVDLPEMVEPPVVEPVAVTQDKEKVGIFFLPKTSITFQEAFCVNVTSHICHFA